MVLAQTAASFFRRIDEPPLQILPMVNMRSGETLEICGEPGTGKTSLLMEIALRCICPRSIDGRPLDGYGTTAIVVDTEGGFCVPRLAASLVERLGWLGYERAQSEMRICLRRLHIMQPHSRRQVVCGLAALLLRPRIASDQPTPLETARFLLIDRLTAPTATCCTHCALCDNSAK